MMEMVKIINDDAISCAAAILGRQNPSQMIKLQRMTDGYVFVDMLQTTEVEADNVIDYCWRGW